MGSASSASERRRYVLGLLDIFKIKGYEGDFSFYLVSDLKCRSSLAELEHAWGLSYTTEEMKGLQLRCWPNGDYGEFGAAALERSVTPAEVAWAIVEMRDFERCGRS